MRIKTTVLFVLSLITIMVVSCSVEPLSYNLIGDDKKIDIKGSLMNGDMKNPNIEAGFWDKTVHVYFHDYMGKCTVSISNQKDEILFADTLDTYPDAAMRFFMGDLPKSCYYLIINNGTDKAEGWFNNFHIVGHLEKP